MKEDTLARLWSMIQLRKNANPEESWTAKLLDQGTQSIAKKVGEEAVEVVIASLSQEKKDVIAESSDLLYHLFVLWQDQGIEPDDIYKELEKRFDISGIEEKKSRLNNA